MLGVFFAGEHLTIIQVGGLAIILTSVLLINLAKYRKEKEEQKKIIAQTTALELNSGSVKKEAAY